MSNNYKDNAQDDLKKLEAEVDSLRSSGGIKPSALEKYGSILDELRRK